MDAERREVRLERPDVAAGHRPGQRRPDPERPGVAQGLLDERAVDRQRAGLVEAGHPAQLGDRVEQGDEAAGRQDRRGVVGGLRARAPGGPGVAPIASAMSASSAASWSSPSMATVAPWSAATARSVSAKATSGWNAPIWVPAAIAGARTSAPSAPLVWTIAWPLYIRSEPASGAMASSGTARMISSTSSRSGSGSAKTRAPSTSERNRSRRPGRGWRPRGPASRPRVSATPRAVPTAPAPTMPMIGGSPGPGMDVRMGVVARVGLVAVAVRAGRRRVEVDAGRLDGGLRLGAIAAVAGRRRADRPRPS